MGSTPQSNDLLSGLLSPNKMGPNMMLEADFFNPNTVTPPLDLMDTSFNIPMDLSMGDASQWKPNGMPLESWEDYGSQ